MTEWMDPSERVLVKYPLFKTAVARIQACFDSFGAAAEPDCCPIVGESGGGKTTIISYFASLHPRIDHNSGVEIPVLLAKVAIRLPMCIPGASLTLYGAALARPDSLGRTRPHVPGDEVYATKTGRPIGFCQ